MGTQLPRLNVVLEGPLFDELRRAARRDGLSASAKARDLIREALEIQEDAYFARVAGDRLGAARGKTLTHAQVWGTRRR
ncbi:MAG: antitoxin, RHH family protein [Candidatus Coatesbacteria bacterium]